MSRLYHCEISPSHTSFQWEQNEAAPFDELIITWNSYRPLVGYYEILVSLKIAGRWSPWLPYAHWYVDRQRSFESKDSDFPIKVYQDTIEVLSEDPASGFRVCVEAKEGAKFHDFFSLYACVTHLKKFSSIDEIKASQPIKLSVSGLSQCDLKDARKMRLCSPTSTTAVVRYLNGSTCLDPLNFANRVRDGGFDIYGNWIFNVAQAYVELKGQWKCWVQRLSGFDKIYQQLEKGRPVVVSIKGPLPGAPRPYQEGHLLVVIGYLPDESKVICMDPAFEGDMQTIVAYETQEFLQAWNRRKNLAYLFDKT